MCGKLVTIATLTASEVVDQDRIAGLERSQPRYSAKHNWEEKHLNGWNRYRRSGEIIMVSNCANPQCAKPLHYLREGRIFVFEVQGRSTDGADTALVHCLEHFRVEYGKDTGMRLVTRQEIPRIQAVRENAEDAPIPTALAS